MNTIVVNDSFRLGASVLISSVSTCGECFREGLDILGRHRLVPAMDCTFLQKLIRVGDEVLGLALLLKPDLALAVITATHCNAAVFQRFQSQQHATPQIRRRMFLLLSTDRYERVSSSAKVIAGDATLVVRA